MSATYPARGMQRILAGAATPVLRATLYDQDGNEAVDATGATCTITRADGTVVATNRATTVDEETSAVHCELTTVEGATLDVLTATWSISGVVRATTYHRTVGAFLFPLGALAARPGMGKVTTAQLIAERDRVTDLIEEHTGLAWCPQFDIEEFTGHGTYRHATVGRPIRRIRSLSIDETSIDLTTADLDIDQAAGIISGVWFCELCSIGLEHGFAGPPADLRDAALAAAADRLLRENSPVSSRARSITNDIGITQQLSYAGEAHPTGLDEVDAVIIAHARARL